MFFVKKKWLKVTNLPVPKVELQARFPRGHCMKLPGACPYTVYDFCQRSAGRKSEEGGPPVLQGLPTAAGGSGAGLKSAQCHAGVPKDPPFFKLCMEKTGKDCFGQIRQRCVA